ncbi:MAG TPA: ATPase [Planctomycetaceae bacterium]|nr:ATPase [Planctomycetaceae bacterium]
MLDQRSPESGTGPAGAPRGSEADDIIRRTNRQIGEVSDLYTKLFQKGPSQGAPSNDFALQSGGMGIHSKPAPKAPIAPTTLAQSGLSLMQICDLILKQLYLQGAALGVDLARQMRLPFNVIDEALVFLKDEKCIEVGSGDLIGRVSYRFNLTDLGRARAREAFDQCRYVGPAPVPLDAYVRQCLSQTVTGTVCDAESLQDAFAELIIRPGLLEELGPAVCSGKSIFIYGPPGNGKTMIAKGLGRFLNRNGGEIFVPYAISSENSIVTIFDPTIHTATDNDDLLGTMMSAQGESKAEGSRLLQENPPDLRWRRIKRPVVITGGELTLEMLDLRYNTTANFYQAPLHIKANGGVFLIDDFGRQIVSPRDLLNRWILPLEERIDYMTLSTGKKFAVPFEQLIIFSTNLDPRELVDEAFLRRIRHKIAIGTPDKDLFTDIFQLACRQRGIPFNQEALDYLYFAYYDKGKPPRSSDPRDLLEIVQSICRFRNQEVALTENLIAEAALKFFCQI